MIGDQWFARCASVIEMPPIMRTQRKYLLAPDHETCAATYHCVSRVVWRQFLFKKEEKEFFRKAMRQYEAYCGVKVLAYCLMCKRGQAFYLRIVLNSCRYCCIY